MGKINVKAKETRMKIGSKEKLFILNTESTYSNIPADEVLREVAKKLNVSKSVIRECMAAIPEIIESHACNGHSVTIPYVGTFRFGFNSEAVEKVEDVSKKLIKSVKLVFVPNKEIKQMLKDTSINITCYDLQGNVIKRVTDRDTVVDDNDQQDSNQQNSNEPEPTLYTLTWKHDGTVQHTEQLTEGATITEPTAPSGYHWKDVPATMPGHALEIVSEEDSNEPPVLS